MQRCLRKAALSISLHQLDLLSLSRRDCDHSAGIETVNVSSASAKSAWSGLEQSVPDYFSGVVLLRSSPTYPENFTGELRFQTLFNIVVIWMAVFIGLSKGLKSYGKVSFLFGVLPVVGFVVFATKVLGLLPFDVFVNWFCQADWAGLTTNVKVCS